MGTLTREVIGLRARAQAEYAAMQERLAALAEADGQRDEAVQRLQTESLVKSAFGLEVKAPHGLAYLDGLIIVARPLTIGEHECWVLCLGQPCVRCGQTLWYPLVAGPGSLGRVLAELEATPPRCTDGKSCFVRRQAENEVADERRAVDALTAEKKATVD